MDANGAQRTESAAERLARMSPERRELAARLLARGADGEAPAGPIPRRGTRGPAPLSFAQRRLWVLEQLTPESPFYNETHSLSFSGPLDVAALERALNEIVRRHEALRTTFTEGAGEPLQVVAPALILPLPVVDLAAMTEDVREDEARRLAREEAQRRVDLHRGPLIRTTLLRLSPSEHRLLVTIHHIVCDGWSMGVLAWELGVLYRAFAAGKPSPLHELPVQYADFAEWQRRWLGNGALSEPLRYWRTRLADLPELALPADHPRPAVPTFRGDRRAVLIPPGVRAALRALGETEGATLFMVMLAAFQTLLCRYTGEADVVVGAPVAGRTRKELEGLIGFFVNTLVLRTDLSGNPSFREAVRRVRDASLGAFAHQDVPFEKLVETLHPARDLARNPLFQVIFQLFATPSTTGLSPEQVVPVNWVGTGIAKFDLRVDLHDTRGGLSGFVEYSTDLFEAATIARMVDHFLVLLQGVVRDPDQRLSALPLLSPGERRRLLEEWGAAPSPYPRDACVHHLFQEQAARTPEAAAVVEGERTLSYAELDRRAGRLARRLQALGAGPGARVAVCMERSV
ncbi:MAG TPA: condensation domain-containing protein, partial [Longimicrobiaceae bacterium]|nr:condensation domain-containing protein [Longimicrobiaceae bacterium]